MIFFSIECKTNTPNSILEDSLPVSWIFHIIEFFSFSQSINIDNVPPIDFLLLQMLLLSGRIQYTYCFLELNLPSHLWIAKYSFWSLQYSLSLGSELLFDIQKYHRVNKAFIFLLKQKWSFKWSLRSFKWSYILKFFYLDWYQVKQ